MQLWQLIIDAPLDAVDDLSDRVAESALAVDIDVQGARARVTGLYPQPLDEAATHELATGNAFHWHPLEHVDWLQETARLGAGAIGRFSLLDAPSTDTTLLSNRALYVESAHAFGDGFHATTRGCLLALDALKKKTEIRHYADVGCGTGVLALGARKLWPKAHGVLGDIDADAVSVTRLNRTHNGGASRMQLTVGAGMAPRAYKNARPYDLVMANILAGPLCRLAPAVAASLVAGGYAVLSGLLAEQQAMVLAAYRQQRLRLVKSTVINDWVTLVLRKPSHGSTAAA